MFEPSLERPGDVSFNDDNGKRHTVSVFSMGTPKEAGPNTTYLQFTDYRSRFVRVPLAEVKKAAKRARTLRKAQIATQRRGQLEFDFNEKETAAQLPTETAAANTHPTDEARNGGS
jgi:hypothetical protein